MPFDLSHSSTASASRRMSAHLDFAPTGDYWLCGVGQCSPVNFREADVGGCALSDRFDFLVADGATNLRGYPRHQGTRRDMHPLEYDGARCDQRASSDHSVVENCCVHSDKAVVLNNASVHDCTVADRHPVPDCAWGIRIGVEHCVVLDVGFSSNADGRGVGPDRGTVKYARPGVDLSVVQDGCRRSDECRGIDDRCHPSNRDDERHHTGQPICASWQTSGSTRHRRRT